MPTELRPTVFIALGGTGAHIAARLRQKMLEVYAEVPALFDMLVVDTARPPVIGEELPEERFLQLKTDTLQDYIDNRESHPNIMAWLPDPDEWSNISRDDLHDGAQKVRSLGRLSLFVHENGTTLYNRLREAINGVTGVDLSPHLIQQGIQATAGIPPQVYIISSAIGGTGSGILLDVANMVRHEFGKNGAFVTAVLLLPGVFGSTELLQANCCACLQEIDHYMTHGGFSAEYPGLSMPATSEAKPFNVCYLIDNANDQRVTLNAERNAHSMVAEALFAISASREANAFHQYFVDGAVGAVRGGHARNQAGADRECFYSSLGAHSLRFPHDEVAEICAARRAEEMLQLLTRSPDLANEAVRKRTEGEVMDFINRNAINEFPQDQIINALTQKALKDLDEIHQEAGKRLVHVGETALSGELKSLWQKMEGALTRQWIPGMTGIAKSLLDKASDALQTTAIDCVNDYGGNGPTHANQYLAGVKNLTDGWSNRLSEEAKTCGESAKRDAEGFKRTSASLGGLLKPSLIDRIWELIVGDRERPERVQQLAQRMLELCLSHHSQQLKSKATEHAASLFASLSAEAGKLGEEVRKISELLTNASSEASSRSSTVTASRSSQPFVDREGNPVITSVVTHADVDRIYASLTQADAPKEKYDLLLADVASFLNGRYIYDLRGSGKGTLQTELESWAQAKFDALLKQRYQLEQFLQSEKATQVSAVIAELKNKAAPFCALRFGRGGPMDNPTSANIYATANQDTTLFADHFPPSEYHVRVSTLDYFQMSVINTDHGFPLFVLEHCADYAKALTTLRAKKENPCYTAENSISSRFAGIDAAAAQPISESREVADLLDLGMLVDLVQIKGAVYSYHPADGGRRLPLTSTGKAGRPAACAYLTSSEDENALVRASLEKDLVEKVQEYTSTSKKSYQWLCEVWMPFRRERLTLGKSDARKRSDWNEYDPLLIQAVAKRANVNLSDL